MAGAGPTSPFMKVDNGELNINDFYPVYDKVKSLSAHWRSIAISLRLKIDDINNIEASSHGNALSCLQKVLEHWLKKDYDYEAHDVPCWRMVCVAVKEGGADPALADQIAHEHPITEKAMSPISSIGDTEEVSHEYRTGTAVVTVEPVQVESVASSEKDEDASKYISPEKSFSLVHKLRDLKYDFDEAIRVTKNSFELKDLPKIIDYLTIHVTSILGPTKKQQTSGVVQAVREEFQNIDNLGDLFITLQDKYVSWFNYDLILKLVRVFLSKNRSLIRRTWSAYEEKLKDYFINSGGLLIDIDAVEFGITDVPPGTRVMIAKVDRDDYKLDDLFFFQGTISRCLDVPEYPLYFRYVRLGSLCLAYLIPDYLYSILPPPTPELQQQLASIGIMELTCGEYVYHLKEIPAASQDDLKHQNLVSNIDICDRLWYENTSTPLHEACWRGLIDEVQWLIDKFGYSMYHRGLNGWTPLHSASYGGHIEILQLLIDQKRIDPNEGDDNSVSSLHMASYNGHLPVVQYLIDTCHVPPDQPDNSNNTALLYSAMGGHSDLVEFFIKRNCNASQINCRSISLSLLACRSGQVALVGKLEELNLFSPKSTDILGSTILHYCCMKNNLELFKYLLTQYKLAIDMKDKSGRTPLHFASWFASLSVVEYIVSIQGNEALLVTDNNGRSCLHYASDAGMGVIAGIVYSKLYAPCDALTIQVINNTHIKHNIDFIKRNERVRMFSLLLKKASTCPNFNINATTTNGESLLHLASRTGSTLLVKALEEYNINPSLADDGASPVHWAAYSGSTSVLGYIISCYNLNANDPDYTGCTPLVYSCRSGSINSVQYLINNRNSDPNITDNDGVIPLHYSCLVGHIDITQYLIEVQHCDINKTDNERRTLVHHAAWSGNFDLVQYLITEQGLSPTALDKDGLTALHYASRALNLPLVKELITTHHLDPHQADSDGSLPIHCAARSGDILLLELYVNTYKCSVSVTNKNGANIVHYSSSQGHTHFIKHIVNQYPELRAVHVLVEEGHLNVLKYLIDNNYCNPNVTDHQDRTPLHVAVVADEFEILEYLLESNLEARINVQDKDGDTPLHLACGIGQQKMVPLFLSSAYLSTNNSVLVANKKGQTPLHLAAAGGHKDSAEALLFTVAGSSTHQNLLTARDNEGRIVLHTACSNGHLDVFRYLCHVYSEGVTSLDNRRRGLLHAACEGGEIEIVKELVEKYKLDPESQDKDGITCLHLLAERKSIGGFLMRILGDIEAKRNIEIYQYLRHHIDSNPIPKDKSGRTPLHYASGSGNILMVRYLIESFTCRPDDPDDNGYTSVHAACEAGNMELVRYYLKDLNCNPHAETNDNRTILYYASKSSNLELVRFLVDVFKLKPHPHDITVAQSSVVEYLQKVCEKIKFEEWEEERRLTSKGYREKLVEQQIDPQRHDVS